LRQYLDGPHDVIRCLIFGPTQRMVGTASPANLLAMLSGTPFAPPLSDYGKIAAPTLVIRGANSHPGMMRIAELLAAHIPHASLETVAGGSHFLPATIA